jgi:tRNA-dihydrouridine synthase 4
MSKIFERLLKDKPENEKVVKICAPMVRYSKLPFRMLVREFGCDLAFTPMILADAFSASEACRNNEFTTNREDRPLIVQFAANKADDFVSAAKLVSPYSDGVDLNCGCPQRWAIQEGIGACLINKPEFIKDLVRRTKSECSRDDESFSVSVKIRIHDNIERTVDLCR